MARIGVLIALRVTESAVRNFRRVSQSIDNVSESGAKGERALRGLDTAMAAIGSTAAIALGAISLRAADLENVMARLETVTRSTTQTVTTSLRNAEENARKFSTEFAISARDVIDAQFQLATAGVAVEEQLAGVNQAFKLSEATVGDFTEATKLLGQFLNTFGTSVRLGYLDPLEKATRITDILSSTVQRFQVTLPVLAQGFKFIIGPARQLNLSLEETAVALGILNTAGFRGTLAGTALSNMFNKLNRAVERLNLDPSQFQDLGGNLKSLASFMKAVNDALGDLTPIEAQIKLIEVFDIRAGRVIKTLADNNVQLAKMSNELAVANGATEKMSRTIQSTTTAQLKRMVNAFDNIATSIGKTLNVFFRPFIAAVADGARNIADFVERNRGWITTLSVLVASIAALKALQLAWNLITTISIRIWQNFAASMSLANVQLRIGLLEIKAATGAMAIFKGVTLIAAGAVRILAAAVGALFVIGSIVTIVDLLIGGFRGAAKGSDQFRDSLSETTKFIAESERKFAGLATRAGRVASELERIGKLRRFGSQNPLGIGNLGDTIISDEIAKEIENNTAAKVNEIISNVEKRVSSRDMFANIAELLLANADESLIRKLGEDLNKAFLQELVIDPQALEIDRFEVAGQIVARSIASAGIAMRGLVGDTEEQQDAGEKLVNIFNNILNLQTKIGEIAEERGGIISFTARGNKARDRLLDQQRELEDSSKSAIDSIIETFVKAEATLGDSPIFQPVVDSVRSLRTEMGFAADQNDEFANRLKALVGPGFLVKKELTDTEQVIRDMVDSTGFLAKRSNELGVEFLNLTNMAQRSANTFNRSQAAINRLLNTTSQLANGSITAAKAQQIFDEVIQGVLSNIPKQTQAMKELRDEITRLEGLRDAGGIGFDPFAIKELENIKKEVDGLEERERRIAIRFDEAATLFELEKLFSKITGTETGTRIGADIISAASAITPAITELVTKGLSPAELGIKLRDSFRTFLTSQVVQSAGQSLASSVFTGVDKSVDRLQLLIKRTIAASAEELKKLDQTGKGLFLGQVINEATRQVFGMELAVEGVDDKFKELKETIRSIQVASVTAGAEAKALLLQVERILAKPPTTVSGLQAQAASLRELAIAADNIGSTDSLNIILKEYERVLEQLTNFDEQNTATFESIAPLVESVLGDIGANATALLEQNLAQIDSINQGFVANVFDNAISAAQSITAAITKPFESFLEGAQILERVVTSGIVGDITNDVALDFNIGDDTFNITVNSTSEGTAGEALLDDGEVRDILGEAESKLKLFVEDKLRDLEERLRAIVR